jgi:hypothetical protein
MARRDPVAQLRSEAKRRAPVACGISGFQVLVYGIIVAGVVVIAYARVTMP